MERRTVLRSTSALATASAVGLAGCSGILGGGGCGTPSDDLEGALPSGGDYEQQGDPTTSDGGENEDIEQTIIAGYTGPDDEELLFGISEFSDADTASEEEQNVSEDAGGDGEFGYIIAEEFVYFASGPDEESVEALLSESEPLSGCVSGNVEFA